MSVYALILVWAGATGGQSSTACALSERLAWTTVADVDERLALADEARGLNDGECASQMRDQLIEIAVQHHRLAKSTSRSTHFDAALAFYDLYLRTEAPGPAAHRWTFFKAELLWDLGRWADAAASYEASGRAEPRGPHAFEAAYNRLLATERRLNGYGAAEIRDGRVLEPREKSGPISCFVTYPEELTPEESDVVKAADEFVTDWADQPSVVTDEGRVSRVAAAATKAAAILSRHGRSEAIARLKTVLIRWPSDRSARFAAIELLDMLFDRDRTLLATEAEWIARNTELMKDPRVVEAVTSAREASQQK